MIKKKIKIKKYKFLDDYMNRTLKNNNKLLNKLKNKTKRNQFTFKWKVCVNGKKKKSKH